MNQSVVVTPVRTRRDRGRFLKFPWKIYRDDPLWVPPLLPERKRTIDPNRGVFFARGEAEFYNAFKDGRLVGTICAAEDPETNQRRGKRECLFGFFECVNEFPVAEALVNAAAAWGRARGLDTLYGPYHLDYENGYGLLVAGRDRPPVLLCGHTPEYYVSLFRGLGFQPARAANLAFSLDLNAEHPFLERLGDLSERVLKNSRYRLRGADFSDWDGEIDRVLELLNRALAALPDHIGWRRDTLAETVKPFKEIADPDLILFADIDGETVGWLPGVPNLNERFADLNGLRYPWNYLRVPSAMKKRTECLAVKSILIHPEHWNTGAVLPLMYEMTVRARSKGYRWIDLSLTSEDNPNTPTMARRCGAVEYKRFQVYRKPI